MFYKMRNGATATTLNPNGVRNKRTIKDFKNVVRMNNKIKKSRYDKHIHFFEDLHSQKEPKQILLQELQKYVEDHPENGVTVCIETGAHDISDEYEYISSCRQKLELALQGKSTSLSSLYRYSSNIINSDDGYQGLLKILDLDLHEFERLVSSFPTPNAQAGGSGYQALRNYLEKFHESESLYQIYNFIENENKKSMLRS